MEWKIGELLPINRQSGVEIYHNDSLLECPSFTVPTMLKRKDIWPPKLVEINDSDSDSDSDKLSTKKPKSKGAQTSKNTCTAEDPNSSDTATSDTTTTTTTSDTTTSDPTASETTTSDAIKDAPGKSDEEKEKNATDSISANASSGTSTSELNHKEQDNKRVNLTEIITATTVSSLTNQPPTVPILTFGSLDNFFKTSAGELLMDIGLNRVREWHLKEEVRDLRRTIRNEDNNKTCRKLLNQLDKQLDELKVFEKANKKFNFEKCHKCHHCGMKTESLSVLDRHSAMPHISIRREYLCNWCNYKVKDPKQIVLHNHLQHRRRCFIELPPQLHECYMCPYETNSKAKCTSHVVRCAKNFDESSLLSSDDQDVDLYLPSITPKPITQSDVRIYDAALKNIRMASAATPAQTGAGNVTTGVSVYQQQMLLMQGQQAAFQCKQQRNQIVRPYAPITTNPPTACRRLANPTVARAGLQPYLLNQQRQSNLQTLERPATVINSNNICGVGAQVRAGTLVNIYQNPQGNMMQTGTLVNGGGNVTITQTPRGTHVINNLSYNHPIQGQIRPNSLYTGQRIVGLRAIAPGTQYQQRQIAPGVQCQPRQIAPGAQYQPRAITQQQLSMQNQLNDNKSNPQMTKSSTFVICEICDGYIKDLDQLKTHMQWIHKVRIHQKMLESRPPLNCQKCQWRFFTDSGLERHLLGAHGLVTSNMQEQVDAGCDGGRCTVCGRAYNSKLVQHMKDMHKANLKPAHLSYKCTVCSATFNLYRLFENHVYSVHSESVKRATSSQTSASSTSASNAAKSNIKAPNGANSNVSSGVKNPIANNDASVSASVDPTTSTKTSQKVTIPVATSQVEKSNGLSVIENENGKSQTAAKTDGDKVEHSESDSDEDCQVIEEIKASDRSSSTKKNKTILSQVEYVLEQPSPPKRSNSTNASSNSDSPTPRELRRTTRSSIQF